MPQRRASGLLLPVALAALLAACDKLPPDHPTPSGPREGKPVRVVHPPPTDGPYEAPLVVQAAAGTPRRARERLTREAERAGCDVLVLGKDVADEVTGDKGETLTRHSLSGDCFKRTGTAPASP
jgi:hypothetical protein